MKQRQMIIVAAFEAQRRDRTKQRVETPDGFSSTGL